MPHQYRYRGPFYGIGSAIGPQRLPLEIMLNLNDSEARTFQQILNGERLWSWPNGRVQLGQTFPDITVINRLMREGFLDGKYRPTTWGASLPPTRPRPPAPRPTPIACLPPPQSPCGLFLRAGVVHAEFACAGLELTTFHDAAKRRYRVDLSGFDSSPTLLLRPHLSGSSSPTPCLSNSSANRPLSFNSKDFLSKTSLT